METTTETCLVLSFTQAKESETLLPIFFLNPIVTGNLLDVLVLSSCLCVSWGSLHWHKKEDKMRYLKNEERSFCSYFSFIMTVRSLL